jgi:peptidyl-prolyl cis-trans isomerase SurA
VAATAQDAPQLVDRVLAIVDEEAILQSDLDREVQLFRMNQEYAEQPVTPDTPELRREMLDRLVEAKLIIAAAKAADMTVDEEAVARSVDQRIEQFIERFGSREAFQRELHRSGTTESDFRERMASQLRDDQYLRLVVGKFIRPGIEITENDVRDYYLAHLDEMPAEPDSLTLANILVPVQPSVEQRQGIQTRIAEIRRILEAGRHFADVAAEYSQGPNAKRGGEVGVVSPGDLFEPVLDRAVFSLAPGEISDPVVSSRGVHLLKVDAVREDGRRAISQIFLPIEITQEDVDKARQVIDAARERLLDGETFAAVAAEVSADPVSAASGGVLGTFRLEDLSEQFQEVLAGAAVGEITVPVLTPAGWYLFRVQGRTEGRMYTYEDLKEDLRVVVENVEIEKALADYVVELRTRFFIDEKT